ncbi:hypothetical protein F5Y09DRAFT_356471 [Xylaria sp. FL1042]|nr:hypothetical protein F5Y09DRAFT_356471 [Xylaria sp. FL1042]
MGLGLGMGREITEIPMCANCAVACENDDRDALLKRALRRIDVADGGLSRQRWKTRYKSKIPNPRTATSITTRQSQLGGDSSMDMVSSPSPDFPLHLASPTVSSSFSGAEEGKEGETLAKLHYRRSRDPRFAQLDCLVPFDASLYVSIFDPINAPAFKPHPAKPLPKWMSLLPGRGRARRELKSISRQDDNAYREVGEEEEGQACWSPRSILDVHFPPAAAFAARRNTHQADPVKASDIIAQTKEPTNERDGIRIGRGMDISHSRARLSGPFASSSPSPPMISSSPPPLFQPQHRMGEQRISESDNSQSTGHLLESDIEDSHEDSSYGSRRRSESVLSLDLGYTEGMKDLPLLKAHYKRPSVVADEPLRRPSNGFRGLGTYEHLDAKLKGDPNRDRDGDWEKERCRAVSTSTASNANVHTNTTTNTNLNNPRKNKSNPILSSSAKTKAKTVAWDSTVAGGESLGDESCEQVPTPGEKERGEQCAVSPRCSECPEYPEYTPRRCPSPLAEHVAAIWRRAVRTGTPPAQPKKFLDLYRVGRGGADLVDVKKDDAEKDPVKEKGVKEREAKEVKTRFAHPSLAVPGRRRGKEIGVCPTCGSRSTY